MTELKERTFIAIKPDGVQRGIIGEVIKRFEAKGFKLVGMKMLHVSTADLMPIVVSFKCSAVWHMGQRMYTLTLRTSAELISLLVYS